MALKARVAVLVAFVLACATTLADAAPTVKTATTAQSAQAAGGCRDKTLVPTRSNVKRIRTATVCLVNVHRRSHGLKRVRSNADLQRAAQRYSRLMVSQRFFDHVAPDGTTLDNRVAKTRYTRRANAWALGENLAWGEDPRSTPLATVRKWMASPFHRTQVLAPHFRDIGVGITRGAPMRVQIPGATYSAVFGGRSMR
jgi:uncharacterized protein YkwD